MIQLMSTLDTPRKRARCAPRVLAVAGILAMASACSPGGRALSPFDGPVPAGASATDDPISIEIQNLSFNDITVWAMRPGGQRQRIARVTGKSDDTVKIRWNVAMPIAFFVEQTAGRSCSVPSVGVEPDATVVLSIPSNVGLQPCRSWRR
jgi:hypothetical protein